VPEIAIESEVRDLDSVQPFGSLLRLRERWGEGEVSLLESVEGPERDLEASLIGFGPVLRLVVVGSRIRLSGSAALREHLERELLAAGALTREGDQLRMPSEGALWRVLRVIGRSFVRPEGEPDAFRFGFMGYLGYDVVRGIERLPYLIAARDDDAPQVELTIYQGVLTFDMRAGTAQLRLNRAPGYWEPIDTASTVALLEAPPRPGEAPPDPTKPPPPVPAPRAVRDTMTHEAFVQKVATALHHISIGDIYQVQLGHEIRIQTDADPLTVYQRLRVGNPSPYMYLMPFEDVTLVGASPEAFLRLNQGRISMRPIAGTARRGATPEEDAALVDALRHDDKELAEHIMLVDLCRNDIGRVCRRGTLETDELLVVEQYSHVNHLVSNVTGELREGVDCYEVIAATFPAGTMTGAPKIRAMEIIEDLETTRRGAYAGAVGLIDFSGYVNMALCIRSTIHVPGEYALRASAGVVADSVADSEWRESLHKMGATYWAVTGEELGHEGVPH